jgi:hypothetical protein
MRRDVVELLRHQFQARRVVLVVLDGLEGEERDELRGVQVDAAHLADRHLPVPEALVLDRLLQAAHEERFGQRLLLRESRRVDLLEAGDPLPVLLLVGEDLGFGEVRQFVVPALVAQDGRELRALGERVLPVVGEKLLEGLAAGREIVRRGRPGDQARPGQNEYCEDTTEHGNPPLMHGYLPVHTQRKGRGCADRSGAGPTVFPCGRSR